MTRMGWIGLAALGAVSMAVLAEEPAKPVFKFPPGYISAENAPDSAALIPPAPAAKSGAEARDKAASKLALAQHGKPRWDVATSDADLFSAKATGALSCAAGFEISPAATPALDKLLRRSIVDFGLATSKAKKLYSRDRPFELNKQPICTPEAAKPLAADGSYPSGHSAIGFGWGMVLAQLVPDRATQVMARGRAYGESRRFCNVHWQADVEEGRVIAAAVFARLQSEPAYQADLQAARDELAKPRQAPSRDCAAEAAALAGG
ncbi:acid phosphatase [Novosphingobium sp. B 225]|uniref:acid phosphatase n=1 Tax=Novosphingobium sp. B 225 TaxID=1961849 RepID=UPI0015962F5A|nr:phosphatase PAP2 family protein [Novosphingobium sp. B 225]